MFAADVCAANASPVVLSTDWRLALLVSATVTAGSMLIWRWRSISAWGGSYNAIASMVLAALFMHFGGGSGEAHFPFFVLTSFLLYYQNWRPIAIACVTIALHHIGLYGLQSLGIRFLVLFSCPTLGTLATHLLIATIQGVMLSYMAQRLALLHKARNKAFAELQVAAATFDSQEAMLVTDANAMILRVNKAFVETTGYSADELVGKSPSIIKSGRHDKNFYRTMWETIHRTGMWQGEIWDRRKNGEEYPKWLTISAVKNEQGVVTNYIGSHFDITERKKAEDKIKELAFFDALTGLSNRFSLQERLEQALSLAERNEKQLAVMLIDLDNFKTINDTLGHSVGDQLLIQVAQRLAGSVRQSDLVARLGGDEFVVVLPDIDSPTDAANVADKILISMSDSYPIGAQALFTSPSIGICLYPDDGTQREELLKKADVAMYHAKSNGKNNYQFFRDEIQVAAVKRIALEADLRKALEQRQFVLYYQPQLDLRTGHLSGVEALVRWQHPERGLVPPNDFISVAEETGLILPLGGWVLEQACRQLATWHAHGLDHLRMSVNLAASQFIDPRLPMRIEAILAQLGLPATSLDLEVTESMTMQSPEETAALMRVLTGQGLSISIDDFGTGYSSLAYLKTFPVSTLKIDRSFVKDIETNQNDADICDVTVLLAHKLGFEVVAEGVETEAQLKYLLSIGCEKIQGYLISKPLPADQVEEFIHNNSSLKGLGTIDLWSGSEGS